MDPQDFKDLLNRYAAEECSPEEQRVVERFMLKYPVSKKINWKSELHKDRIKKRMQKHIFDQVDRDTQIVRRKTIIYWRSIAATLLFITGISAFFYFQKSESIVQKQVIAQAVHEVYDEVTLTGANGHVTVFTNKDSVLDLRQSGAESSKWNLAGALSTLRVPSQHQFAVVLMDGTKVWLNAGSSLSFPAQFAALNRTVTLEGEAYFEVLSNRSKPFKVNAKQSEIKVTGTKFNVSAYGSEPRIITSLFEGAVEFKVNNTRYPIKPGYEIVADKNKSTVEMKPVDQDQSIAWKDGYFVFNNMDLVTVMKHVARWYNITVTAPARIPAKRIGGTFPNTASLDDLLKDLELLSGVKLIRIGKEVQVVN